LTPVAVFTTLQVFSAHWYLPSFWRSVPNAALKLALPDKLIPSQDVSSFQFSTIFLHLLLLGKMNSLIYQAFLIKSIIF